MRVGGSILQVPWGNSTAFELRESELHFSFDGKAKERHKMMRDIRLESKNYKSPFEVQQKNLEEHRRKKQSNEGFVLQEVASGLEAKGGDAVRMKTMPYLKRIMVVAAAVIKVSDHGPHPMSVRIRFKGSLSRLKVPAGCRLDELRWRIAGVLGVEVCGFGFREKNSPADEKRNADKLVGGGGFLELRFEDADCALRDDATLATCSSLASASDGVLRLVLVHPPLRRGLRAREGRRQKRADTDADDDDVENTIGPHLEAAGRRVAKDAKATSGGGALRGPSAWHPIGLVSESEVPDMNVSDDKFCSDDDE
jgi:hypothetical protein